MDRKRQIGPSLGGWALLLMVLITAVFLRFWQLGELPPGLYRDEAYNGLDALRVLDGQHALFFAANNGREPGYIYLTALFVALLGRSALAVRVAAAVVGSVTTGLVYLMGRDWFDRRVGLLAAWMWAITVWPVHLSRIGLRPVLLPFGLALAAWLGALAYRRNKRWLWLTAGAAYGFSFYTYLAVRFTPILLLLMVAYLWWHVPHHRYWPGLLWFGVGTAVLLLPWIILFMQQPDLILGRSGQVSILNPVVNGGHVWQSLWPQFGRGLGMFIWRGDTILRHNPAGRPVFDLVMAVPFLAGVGWCVHNWRRPAAMFLLLWTAVMLGPTILSADAPHFLRASGLLPAVLLLPAIGLSRLWQWSWLPRRWRQAAVIMAALGSLAITVRDYEAYGNDADVAFMFETAALEMAERIQAEPPETAVYVDYWFWDEPTQGGWAAVPYLVDLSQVQQYRPEFGVPPPNLGQPVAVYGWELGSLAFVPTLFAPPALVTVERGNPARLDFQEDSFSMYVRYHVDQETVLTEMVADVGHQFWLRQADVSAVSANELAVTLYWEAETAVTENWTAFVHVLGPDGLVGQDDALPGVGLWPSSWWQPGIVLADRHLVTLAEPFDRTRHQIVVGLYDVATATRLPVYDQAGEQMGDSLFLPPE